jgi:hypothetical protein
MPLNAGNGYRLYGGVAKNWVSFRLWKKSWAVMSSFLKSLSSVEPWEHPFWPEKPH